jgi:hypothetical protein
LHMRQTSAETFILIIFSAPLLIILQSHEIVTHITIRVPLSLSQISMFGILLGMLLSVCTCWFHNKIIVSSRLVLTNFGICSYQYSSNLGMDLSGYSVN